MSPRRRAVVAFIQALYEEGTLTAEHGPAAIASVASGSFGRDVFALTAGLVVEGARHRGASFLRSLADMLRG